MHSARSIGIHYIHTYSASSSQMGIISAVARGAWLEPEDYSTQSHVIARGGGSFFQGKGFLLVKKAKWREQWGNAGSEP